MLREMLRNYLNIVTATVTFAAYAAEQLVAATISPFRASCGPLRSYYIKRNKGEIMKKEETVTITKTTLWQGVSLLLVIALAASIFTGGFGGVQTGSANVPQPTNNQGGPPQPAEINLEGAYSKGEEDAPVTIVEYSDFQCPFCGRFYTQTLPQIQEQYVETGKVRFVYKDFPLDSIHPQATPAALAARCAGEQSEEAFWGMHDLMFENQGSLSESSYNAWASQLGLDATQFSQCLTSQKYLNEVRADLQEGSNAGIRGTPGFLINGQLVSGAQPFSVFQQVIEAELAKAN